MIFKKIKKKILLSCISCLKNTLKGGFLEEDSLYSIALERWENKDDAIITAEEMHKRLEL